MTVFGIIILVAGIFCATQESKVTGTYKACHVYGRFYAYLALDFLLVGIMSILGFTGISESKILSILVGLLFLALAILMYWNKLRKCPEFLKKKLIPSMLITGLGVTVKVCVFFLGFVWKLTGPQTMRLSDGREVYVFSGGEVYDPEGRQIGHASPDKTGAVIWE